MQVQYERRKYKRFKVKKIDTDYQLIDFTFWSEFRSHGRKLLKDISLGGICFFSEDILPEDSLLSLKLKVRNGTDFSDIYGRVVRSRQTADKGYEIGVDFTWWTKEEDKKSLVDFLESCSDPA